MPDHSPSEQKILGLSRTQSNGTHLSGDRAAPSSNGIELDCDSFELYVQELLDQRQSPQSDRAVQSHASKCAECDDLLQQFIQLESTLQLALKARVSEPRSKREFDRPLHPVSRRQRERISWAAQAAAVLLLCCGLVGWAATRQPQANALLPVAFNELPSRGTAERLLVSGNGIRPVVHYRSLEQCYELTSELPGVRPLQSSIQVAITWWWNYLNLDGDESDSLPHHERGFGLNPLFAEANRQV